jgi:hypothetical protein
VDETCRMPEREHPANLEHEALKRRRAGTVRGLRRGPPLPMTIALLAAFAVAAALPLPATATSRETSSRKSVRQGTIGHCTMSEPSGRVTVEVEIQNAADFCELVSHPLAGEVFRSTLVVTSGLLWYYPEAPLSCRLRYGTTRARMTVHNSPAACRWLRRLARGWHFETAAAKSDHRSPLWPASRGLKGASAGNLEGMSEDDRDPQRDEAEARQRLGDAQAEAEETLDQAEELADEPDSGSEIDA